jgi:hypothetical protein
MGRTSISSDKMTRQSGTAAPSGGVEGRKFLSDRTEEAWWMRENAGWALGCIARELSDPCSVGYRRLAASGRHGVASDNFFTGARF